MESFNETIIAEYHGKSEIAYGLSIYFPNKIMWGRTIEYRNTIDFSKDTFWDEFIIMFVMFVITNLIFK